MCLWEKEKARTIPSIAVLVKHFATFNTHLEMYVGKNTLRTAWWNGKESVQRLAEESKPGLRSLITVYANHISHSCCSHSALWWHIWDYECSWSCFFVSLKMEGEKLMREQKKVAPSAERNFRGLGAEAVSFSSKNTSPSCFTSGSLPKVPSVYRGQAQNTQMVICSTLHHDISHHYI